MTDTTSQTHVMAQRFNESEGELGRNFTKVFHRFNELHQVLVTPQTTNQTSMSDATTTSTTPLPSSTTTPTPTASDIFQTLLRELAAYEYGMEHCKMIQLKSMEEMRHYEAMEAKLSESIAATRTSLVQLQLDLDAAKQRRKELEEYEVITKKILALPSRAESIQAIAKLKETEQQLLNDRAALIADLKIKQNKYHSVLSSMEHMSSEWTSEEAVDAELAKKQKMLADAEAALERQRALEEAALNEAALEARLNAQADTDQPEPEQEQLVEDGSAENGDEKKETETEEKKETETEEKKETEDVPMESKKEDGGDTPMDSAETDSAVPPPTALTSQTSEPILSPEPETDNNEPRISPTSQLTDSNINESITTADTPVPGTPAAPIERETAETPTPMDLQ